MTVADYLRTKAVTGKDASAVIGSTGYDLPMRKGTLGPDVVDIITLFRTQAASPTTPASPPRDKALGATALTIMKSNGVAVIAVRCKGSPETLYKRVAHCIPPNLVKDFIVLSIGDEAAGMKPGLCVLDDWLRRPAEVDPETMFNLPRRQQHSHRHRQRPRGPGRA